MDKVALLTNPYVGPRTFTSAERGLFFGRDSEARELLSLVVSQRLVLFYAQSGAGKSSLINARLVPDLEEQGFTILPIVRVGAEIPKGIAQVNNIFLFSLMLSLDQGGGDPARLAHLTLSDFLTCLTNDDGKHYYYADPREEAPSANPVLENATAPAIAQPPAERYDEPNFVLIIDQFEEIFTTHVHRWEDRAEFFEQLEQAMKKDPKMWVVLTLREDYVAALDPYAHQLADKMRARYYMQRMGKEAALQAVQNPAELAGRPFAEGVADQLVNNLSQIRVLGEIDSWPGQYVEPVQLQVVCYQLWENLKSDPTGLITYANLEAYGDVDNALADFYNRTIKEVLELPEVQVSDLKLRLWFSNQLITEAGTRSIIDQGKETTKGLPNQVVKALADRYLLHAEPRAGAIWIELVHDRFVAPIRHANRDAEAKQKEFEAAENARQEAEKQRIQAEARASRQLRRLAVALVVVSLIAVVAAIMAWNAAQLAQEKRIEAESALADKDAIVQGLKQAAEVSGQQAVASQATAQAASARAAKLQATPGAGTQLPPAIATAQADAAQVAATQAVAAQATAQAAVAQATAQAMAAQSISAQVTAQAIAQTTTLGDLWVNNDVDLNLRGEPNPTSSLITLVRRGDHLSTIGPQVGPDASGYIWQQVRTDSGQLGWVVAIGPNGTHLMTRKPDATITAEVPQGQSLGGVGVGSTLTRAADGMVMVYVPGGTFNMGSETGLDNEKPVHKVTLDSFWIDRTEVTNAQYARCVSAGKCAAPSETKSYTRDSYYGNENYANYPVIYVSWTDANNYCTWAGGQLPAEAQWEYAASGPKGNIYPWGNTMDGTLLNFCDRNCPFDYSDKTVDDGYADTAPVGSYPDGASWVGARDLAGNVWDWVQDWYGLYSASSSINPSGPTGPSNNSGKVLRGGSWLNGAGDVRSFYRYHDVPDARSGDIGFRCVVGRSVLQ